MKIITKTSMAVILMGTFVAVNAFGEDSYSQGRGRRGQGPPQAAYTACEDKQAGDTAEFLSPRGFTVTGTCEEDGDRLVLRPDRRRQGMGDTGFSTRGQGRRRQGPPQAAYTACEDKQAGDTAEFVNRRGFTVTGTCEQEGDQLVLRPDCRRLQPDDAVNNMDDN